MIIRSKDQQKTTTSHGKYIKRVILGEDLIPSLLQFAYSEFKRGDIIEKHSHESMAEVFYILKGKLEIVIGNHSDTAEKDDCIVVRAGEQHSLNILEQTKIIYFNICDENSDT